MSLLDNINCPENLKNMSLTELQSLCDEIRDFLVDSVSKTGGHLASNLGVVELTVAMHTVFDVPKDKIIWDVGHQAYVHKILTGRKDKFNTLRKFHGLSGFPKRSESEADVFNTGHSSTSISAALGMARARDLSGDKYNVISVFGDGALTGGMMYEAMNDAGRSKTPLILILNDNAMSISKNVGSVSRYLRNLRLKPTYFHSKEVVENILNKIPFIGRGTTRTIKFIKRSLRSMVIPTTMFDDLGFTYIGPIDGHDLNILISVFKMVKKENKPVFIHVCTKKGKGYPPAENEPSKFHGIGPFDKKTGILETSLPDYSHVFGQKLNQLAQKNKKIVAITGAMPDSTGIRSFAQNFKNRFFDVGIAEQHGVTLAAGLSCSGYIPVIPLYSSFLQRAYDQILHDVCLQNLHVVFPVDRAGIVGADGETHQGIYDISFLSQMPNMSILSPSNFNQLEQMLEYAINEHTSPIAIRYPRGKTECVSKLSDFSFAKAEVIKKGKDVSIIATGRMLRRAEEVLNILKSSDIDCELIAMPTIKPLDTASVIATAMKTGHVITIEDNTIIGGMGQMISSILTYNNINAILHIFAFPDCPIPHGSIYELDKLFNMDAPYIADYILKSVKKK